MATEPAFCVKCGRQFGEDEQFCSACGTTRAGTPAVTPSHAWEGIEYCISCKKHTMHRHPGNGTRECLECGSVSREGRIPLAGTGSPHTTRNILIGVLIAAVIGAYGFEALGSSADVSAECGPFYQPCRITVNNHGVWPVHFNGDVLVDGKPTLASGSGIAGPFGSGTLTLYTASGTALHTMKTVTYTVSVVPWPDFGSQTVTMSGS